MTRTASGVVLAVLALALAAWALLFAPPRALAQEGNAVQYEITPTSGPTGTIITFTGSGCGPDGSGVFVFADRPEGNFSGQEQAPFDADGEGNFEGTIAVPDDVEPGEYPTGVACTGGEAGWPTDPDYRVFTVTAADTVTDDGPTTDFETGNAVAPAPREAVAPVGGVATGGGSTSGSQNTRLLAIGLALVLSAVGVTAVRPRRAGKHSAR